MNIIIAMIQGLILDITYTNEQLQRFASLAAIMVQRDISFSQTYNIDLLNNLIDPDPTDNDFCLFVAMYSALLIVKNEIRGAATESIRVTDGPSTIDLTSYSRNLSEYYKTLDRDYLQAKLDYARSGKFPTGLVVTTPTTI